MKLINALFTYGAEFQLLHYGSEEEAINDVKNHFRDLVQEGRYDRDTDEAHVLVCDTEKGNSFDSVYSTHSDEEFQEVIS
jgi:hypothetical protein